MPSVQSFQTSPEAAGWRDFATSGQHPENDPLATLLDNLPSLLAVLDARGLLLKANDTWLAFARDRGYFTTPDCRGMNYVTFAHARLPTCPSQKAQPAELLQAVLDGRTDWVQAEYPCPFLDGRWMLMSARRLDPALAPMAVVVTHQDITDLANARTQAEAAQQSAARLSADQMGFLTSLSHELRTPLNAIHAYAEMMEQELFGPLGADKYRSYASNIVRSARHLMSLAQGLMDLRRLEQPDYRLSPGPCDLSQLIVDVVEMMRAEAERTASTLVVAAETVRCAHHDAQAVRQILINLVSNSLKHGGEGLTVRISVSRSTDCLEIGVADTGCGMSEASLAKFAQPFQPGRADIGSGGGLGIGLPLCKRLVELHGGVMSVTSGPGSGTQVRLRFPPAPAA